MNPQSARSNFKLRWFKNAAIVLAIFASLAFIAFQFNGGSLVVALAIIPLYFLFFHVLPNSVIGITCPHCLKHIATNTPWICGDCNEINRNTGDYPFINQCEHCKAEPKVYQCHHFKCGEMIFLSQDEDSQHPARRLVDPAPVPPPPEITRRDEKSDLIHQIEMEELRSKQDELKQRKEWAKPKTPEQEIEESFSKYFAAGMGSHEFARNRRAFFAEKYKDDPEMLQKSNEVIDAWLVNRA